MPYIPKKVDLTALNGRGVDILNTIRANATQAYRDAVPEVVKGVDGYPVANQLSRIGQVLMGAPAYKNEFIEAMLNRIGMVYVESMAFQNLLASVKTGKLEYGETIEEVFVDLAKPYNFNRERAADKVFARRKPNAVSAFYTINHRAQYKVTIDDHELEKAFLSESGVVNMITRIISTLATSNELTEWELTLFLVARGILNGAMKPVEVPTGTNLTEEAKNVARAARTVSRQLTFPSSQWTQEGVTNRSDPGDQIVIIDAETEANMDVDVLASAFNMDRTQLLGNMLVVPGFDSIDFTRYDELTVGDSEEAQVPEFTEAERTILAGVKAVIVDRKWFQIYDRLYRAGQLFNPEGLYTNHWLTVEKIFAYSPFHPAAVLVSEGAGVVTAPTATIGSISATDFSTVLTLDVADVADYEIVQTDALSAQGVAVHPYGAVIVPNELITEDGLALTLTMNHRGEEFTATVTAGVAQVGDAVVFA